MISFIYSFPRESSPLGGGGGGGHKKFETADFNRINYIGYKSFEI